MDEVRVLRLIEYRGSRDWVERTVAASIHGTKEIPGFTMGYPGRGGGTITAVTLGDFPEILPSRPLFQYPEYGELRS